MIILFIINIKLYLYIYHTKICIFRLNKREIMMKTILLGLLMTFAAFSSLQAHASAAAISAQCKSKLENILSKKTQFPVEVLHVSEVGMGTWDVEHFILFAEKNVGGILYRALGKGDSGECPVAITSIEGVYAAGDSQGSPNSCMTKAVELSLEQAKKSYPGYLAVFPTEARFTGVVKMNGVVNNNYKVQVQVTTADD